MSRKFSPWAERFPEMVNDSFDRPPYLTDKDGTEHSGIALLLPTKGPKFYNDPAVDDASLHRLSTGVEINRFFTNERYQMDTLHGALTWQLAALNRHLFISSDLDLFPGGHRAKDDPAVFLEAFAAKRMEVNPDEWFNFLHKDRWYDLVSSAAAGGSPDDEKMSVDNPGVWDNLRGSIDLLDRVLKALIIDRHSGFEAMLYGRISRWVDVAQYTTVEPPHDTALVLFTPEMEQKIATMDQKSPYRNALHGLTEEQRITAMAEKLNDLLRLHTWSFAPMDIGYGFTQRAHPEQNWSSLTAVSMQSVKRLVGDEITLAERFIIQFDLTTTLIHEIMHAIMSCRFKDEEIDHKLPEPLIDFEPVSEIGEAMEKRIFGGRYIMTPGLDLPLGTVLHEWPDLGTGGLINGKDPYWNTKGKNIRQPFPVLFISKLFSAEFWDDIYAPGKTAMKFWQSNMFKNYELDETNKDNWDREERAIAQAYRDTHLELRQYRVTYASKYISNWIRSAWGVSDWQFLTTFTKNFRKNEFPCYTACRETLYCDWQSVRGFIQSMPQKDTLKSNWAPFCVGLLMYAAMPVRKSEYSIPNPKLKEARTSIFEPSRDCDIMRKQRNLALPDKFEIEGANWRMRDNQTRLRNVLFNPLTSGTDQVQQEENVTQKGYLSLLALVLDYIRRRGVVVSLRWYREIERCAKDLERQRADIVAAHPSTHLSRWAKEWKFVPPDYSKGEFWNDHVIWNRDTRKFESCPPEVLSAPATSAPATSATTTTARGELPSTSSVPGGFPAEDPQPQQDIDSKENCTIM